MDEQQRQIQRSRQFCKQRCCCFLDGQPVSKVAYVMSRKGQGHELAVLETQIPCLRLPETIERIARSGVYMGIPVGILPEDPHNFPVYVFDAHTHLFVRDGTLEEYELWGKLAV